MQYRTAHRIRYWTLITTVLTTIAAIVLLTLNLGDSRLNVPISVYITVAATGAAASVGWIAATCTLCLLQHIDDRIAAATEEADKRLTSNASGIADIRRALSEFAACVSEYGDQRATAARLETMQHLANPPTPADADRVVTRIGRQATR